MSAKAKEKLENVERQLETYPVENARHSYNGPYVDGSSVGFGLIKMFQLIQ